MVHIPLIIACILDIMLPIIAMQATIIGCMLGIGMGVGAAF
jgi:hypothetical protein